METRQMEFCVELVRGIRQGLLDAFRSGERSRDIAKMYERFESVNGRIDNYIKESLAKAFPNVGWLDTEFNPGANQMMPAGDYWLCDPLDGALNFLQGIPFWSVSLCLIRDGQPQFALVYDPCSDELFQARAGMGAALNGMPIQVSNTVHLSDSILATAHPTFVGEYIDDTVRTANNLQATLPKSQAVRMLGSVSLQLAYVACGRIDGYWEHGFDIYDWWSGALLVLEAGGNVTSTNKTPLTTRSTGIVAGNSNVHKHLSAILSAEREREPQLVQPR